MTLPNYFAVLGVHRGSTLEDMREARRQAARKAHPDVARDDGEQMVLVNEAFNVLTTPVKLARYLIDLGAHGTNCPRCDATGVHFKFRGFTQRRKEPCDECKGTGYLLLGKREL